MQAAPSLHGSRIVAMCLAAGAPSALPEPRRSPANGDDPRRSAPLGAELRAIRKRSRRYALVACLGRKAGRMAARGY